MTPSLRKSRKMNYRGVRHMREARENETIRKGGGKDERKKG